MIPFFVLDRRASLEILKGLFLKFPSLQFGLMTHANVSPQFIELFSKFPSKTQLKYVDEIQKNKREINKLLKRNIIKISDSGVFQKNGSNHTYEELFEKYVQLKVHYGIIKDVLHDMKATLKSAEEAINVYEDNGFKRKFKLIGVAQGNNADEYKKCYEMLQDLGYKYIAIGGLLKRNGNSNYVTVRSEELLQQTISLIRDEYSPEWLFVLGVYHPSRHELLDELGVWGADYKGWLFHYDEFYRNAIKKLEAQGRINKEIREKYQLFLKHKLTYLQTKTPENRKKYWESRKELDKTLKKYGTSLQELRFREVRERLEKEVVAKMLEKETK
ncbi:hypothetical protein [Thermococcus barossii]|uniref:tRNA-guanine(15) transglycosylase-like domain-containing protein n=1 Tax=Thermococcus barossii TaxID=54077 RepID=A0A2Z2MEJ3_9EURY|nr:hypothetical protein [Thermococcus barossii]ASJ03939.1 hypothetical protein A3L01_00615 [Thermococcus barossii]